MKTSETLKAARAKLANLEHWTRGSYARNQWGDPVGPRELGACRFCAVGAVMAALDFDVTANAVLSPELVKQLGAAEFHLNTAAEQLGHHDIVQANDRAGHEAVLTAYDFAIAAAQLEEAAA